MNETIIQLKDVNLEAHRALTVIKTICTMYEGHCKMCPLGVHTSYSGIDYSCGLKEYRPKDIKIQDVTPSRIVQPMYPDTPQNDTSVRITGKR